MLAFFRQALCCWAHRTSLRPLGKPGIRISPCTPPTKARLTAHVDSEMHLLVGPVCVRPHDFTYSARINAQNLRVWVHEF